MKSDFDASVTFAKALAKAGTDAVRTLGEEIEKVGDDIATDETPFQVASGAMLGFQRAHASFLRGAVEAAQEALAVRRGKAAPQPLAGSSGGIKASTVGAAPVLDPAPPLFAATNTNTVTLTGFVLLEELEKKMKDSGYVPAKVKFKNRKHGFVHLFFDDVNGTKFGDYEEILFLAAAFPKGHPDADKIFEAGNVTDLFRKVLFAGATNFVLKVLIDGRVDKDDDGKREDEIIGFGREILGLDKARMVAERFEVLNVLRLSINSPKNEPLLKYELAMDKPEPLERRPPGKGKAVLPPPGPLRYGVVTRTSKADLFRTWSWVFTSALPPSLSLVPEEPRFSFSTTSDIGKVLKELDFDPKVCLWSPGLNGVVQDLDLAGS